MIREDLSALRIERIDHIERYIATHKSVSIDELCSEFQVSKNTIRRDLKEILSRGEFKKTYGSVCVARSRLPLPFAERFNTNSVVKCRIAQRAAQEVKNGDIIYIDSGTTTCHIVDALADKSDVTILTHSLEVINRTVSHLGLTVIALPGMLNKKTLSFVCRKPGEFLRDCNIGKAFMSSDGITVANGATQSTSSEYEVKRAVINRSDEVFLLAEHEKFGQVSLYTYCGLDKIDLIITDEAPPSDFADALTNSGGKICVI